MKAGDKALHQDGYEVEIIFIKGHSVGYKLANGGGGIAPIWEFTRL
jgi:hypothetical protein